MLLVTGAAGFIGTNLVSALCREGHVVRGIDDLSTAPCATLSPGVELLDVRALTPRDLRDVSTVIHLAAHKSVPRSFDEPRQMLHNIEVDRHLLELVRHQPVARLLLATSCEVYGDALEPLAESRPLRPRSPYAAGKVATENLAALFADLVDATVCCTRFFNTFGPGEGLDAVVPRFVHDGLHHRRLSIEGDGTQRRYFTYIDDAVDILLHLIAAPRLPRVVNVGNGVELSINGLATAIDSLIGPLEFVASPGRPNEIARFEPSLHRLRRLVPLAPPTPLTTALAACVAAEQQERERHVA